MITLSDPIGVTKIGGANAYAAKFATAWECQVRHTGQGFGSYVHR